MLTDPRFREPILREPLNEKFERMDRERGTELTITMGFYCADGIVLVADRRGTNGTEVSEVQKIFRFSPTGLLAFSGNDYTWIKEFLAFVSKEKGSDFERVRSALGKYEGYVEQRFGRRPPELVDFAGILASIEGKEPVMWEFGFWKGFDDAAEVGRIAIGSASTQAKVFLRIAEGFQRRMDYTPWRSLGTGLVEWFSLLLLAVLPTYDNTVHGAQTFILWARADGVQDRIFELPPKVIGPQNVQEFTEVVFKYMQKEIPLSDILKVLNSYQLLNEDLSRLLSDYAKENEGFWESY